MASCTWLLWKARCSLIFNKRIPNFHQIGYQAIAIVESLSRDLKQRAGKLTYFPFNFSLSLFSDVAWIEQNKCCGMGFVLINGDNKILSARASSGRANSSV